MNNIALALGGNLGDVKSTFLSAIKVLENNSFSNVVMSSLYQNPAKDCIPGTPDFTNAVITGTWSKTPDELLTLTQKIEEKFGRPPNHKSNMSRTLDIDIILFGNLIISTKKLTIPHPRAKIRDFVLIPLNEIAPLWIFPDTGKTVKQTLKENIN